MKNYSIFSIKAEDSVEKLEILSVCRYSLIFFFNTRNCISGFVLLFSINNFRVLHEFRILKNKIVLRSLCFQ